MLKQADGSYACVAESATRFTLGEVWMCLDVSIMACELEKAWAWPVFWPGLGLCFRLNGLVGPKK